MYRAFLILLLVLPGVAGADASPVVLDGALRAATGQIKEQLHGLDPELSRIEVSPVVRTIRVPTDTREMRVRLPADIRLRARIPGWVEFDHDSGTRTTLPIWFEVRAYKPVLTTARELRVHEVIADDAVVLREINVAGLRMAALERDGAARLRTTRYIAAGRPLCDGDVEPVPPILAQQMVAVRVVSGPVVIDTTGVAEQEGRIGQVIRVRNQGNAARYMALVTGNQQVEATAQ